LILHVVHSRSSRYTNSYGVLKFSNWLFIEGNYALLGVTTSPPKRNPSSGRIVELTEVINSHFLLPHSSLFHGDPAGITDIPDMLHSPWI
jgi:hypothetical protein